MTAICLTISLLIFRLAALCWAGRAFRIWYLSQLGSCGALESLVPFGTFGTFGSLGPLKTVLFACFVIFKSIIEVVPWTKVAFWLHFMSRKLRNLLFFNCVNSLAFVTKAYALISRIRVNNKKCLRNALFHHHQHKRRLELTFISNFSYVSQ